MKRWILALALLVCAAPAWAAGFSLFGSVITTDDADDEEGLGVKAEFGGGEHVDFQIRAAVYEDLLTDADPNVYEIQAVPIDLGINYDFGAEDAKVNAFVGGGVSYWVMDFSVDTTVVEGPPRGADIDPEVGWYAEVGVDVDVHRHWSILLEAVWREVSTEVEGDDVGLPTDQDVSLTGLAGNLGVTLRWPRHEGGYGRY